MARTVKDTNLGTRNAREALAIRNPCYYRLIMQGLHVGYYKGPRGGTWFGRRLVEGGHYKEKKLGAADDILDANGITVLSFAQAQERARTWYNEQTRLDTGLTPLGTPYTVSDALDDYLLDYERRGGKSIGRVKLTIEAHIRPGLGSIELNKLKRERVEAWFADLAKAPRRVRTRKGRRQQFGLTEITPDAVRRRRASANRIFTILRAALNLAHGHSKVLSREGWDGVKPYRETNAPKIRYLTDAESKRLVNACALPFRELVVAALLTGARYGELAQMTAGDFDQMARVVHIARSKSGKARFVQLSDEGIRFFSDRVAGKASNELLFKRLNGKAWGESHQVRPMIEACKAASIVPQISFHILRHTYASRLAMNNAPLHVIASQLGHADTRMTEQHYAHLAPSYISETVRAAFGELGIVQEGNVRRIA